MAEKILNDLKFEINKDVNFKDKKIQLVEAIFKGKNLKRSDILDSMNDLAKQFKSDKIHLGCAPHYKNINKFAPAIIIPTTQAMKLWNPADYPGEYNEYADGTIDKLHFYIINYNAVNTKSSFYTPKKNHHLH